MQKPISASTIYSGFLSSAKGDKTLRVVLAVLPVILLSSCFGPSAEDRVKYLGYAKTKLASQIEASKTIKDQIQGQRAVFAASSKENASQIVTAIDGYTASIDGTIAEGEKYLLNLQKASTINTSDYETLKKAVEVIDKDIEQGNALLVKLREQSASQ